MAVRELIDLLESDPVHRARLTHIETIEARSPRYGELSRPLPEELGDYCNRKGIRLYIHQCAMIERIREGANVIITTSTASGKTLAFTLPIFERFSENPTGTALCLYPTKALANDQLKTIREIERFSGIRVDAALYDGDTPRSRRPPIRERSRMVLSNPYELHQILPWHTKWSKFLSHLQFVVIDEAHRYRGILGSQIAMLLRRLIRICAHYGSHPQFILSTATIANPEEFAADLTGGDAVWIGEDGSPRGRKQFILYNPFFDGAGERSVHQETKDLFLASLRSGCKTLCFTASRRLTELIAAWSRGDGVPGEEYRIRAYRAGYLPEERRSIENDLKEGRLCGVVTTNALELGIDIGALDGVIISGYPGTMMSVWQQAGRSGRRTAASFAALVGFQNPLDQYLMRHPQAFFSRPCEHAVVDTGNPYILAGHLLCAAAELPIDRDRDASVFGANLPEMLKEFEQRHLLREAARGWVYAGRGRAVDAVGLDAISSDTFRVLYSGRLLETMDRNQAYREAYPGAILLHQGEMYVVTEMDTDLRTIRVKETETDAYTQPLITTDVTVTKELRRRQFDGGLLSFGEVVVTEQIVGYTVRRYDRLVSTHRLDLPPLRFTTRALWFTVPDEDADAVAFSGADLAGGLHGAEHALIAIMPFTVICDRRDIGGLSSAMHPATDAPTIFVYDGHEGGIGLAEKAYGLLPDIISMTYELVRDCACTAGCPLCIYSPKCGNANQPLDKGAAAAILGSLTKRLSARDSLPGAS